MGYQNTNNYSGLTVDNILKRASTCVIYNSGSELTGNGLLIAGTTGTNSVTTSVALATGQVATVRTSSGIAILAAKTLDLSATITASAATSGSFATTTLNTWLTTLANDVVGANILITFKDYVVCANIISKHTVSNGTLKILSYFYEGVTNAPYTLILSIGSSTTSYYITARDYYTSSEADALFFLKSGGNITGNVTLAAGKTLSLDGTALSSTLFSFIGNGTVSASALALQSSSGNITISNTGSTNSIVLTSGSSGNTTIDSTVIPKNKTLVTNDIIESVGSGSSIYAQFNGSAIPSSSITANLGSSSLLWNDLYLSGVLSDGTNSVSVASISALTTNGMTLNTEQTVTAKKTFLLTNIRDVAFEFQQYSIQWDTQSGVALNTYKLYGLSNTGMQVTNGTNTITLPVYTKTGYVTVESELQQALKAALNAVGERLGFTCTDIVKNSDGTYTPSITDTVTMRVFGVTV